MTTAFSRVFIAEESTFSRLTKFQGQKAVAWSGRANQALEELNRLAGVPSSFATRRAPPQERKFPPAEYFTWFDQRERAAHDFARLRPF
jgi:hypothetical protein